MTAEKDLEMKKNFVTLFLYFCIVGALFASQNLNTQLYRIEQATTTQLDVLVQSGLIIDNVRGLNSASAWQPRGSAEIDFWANPEEAAKMRALGVWFQVIENPAEAGYLEERAKPARDRAYHDYTALTSALQSFASSYPSITRLYSAGTSEQGRELWILEMSDNPGVDENEPEFKYISTMHGDEPVGTEMMLELIEDLLQGYGSDSRLTQLMNDVEMHFMPLMNPDGNQAGTRSNAYGVDLNRDFPDPYVDPVNTPTGRAAETAAVMNWSAGKDFDLSVNFHTGALVVNYPFDTNSSGSSVYTATPDDDFMIEISEDYSSANSPMWNGSFNNGITNGADWYAISGGMQDWVYVYEGGMELTLELSNAKWPSSSALPGLWSDNRESMIRMIEWSLRGVRGVVTDANTGLPLSGVEVRVQGRDHATWSASGVGDYHRVCEAGNYSLVFSKDGYFSQTLTGISVGTQSATVRNVALVPEAPTPELELASVLVLDGHDGILDPGESASIQLVIENTGTDYATSTWADLTGGTPYLDILTAAQSLGQIAPGGDATASFDVFVHADAPLGTSLSLLLDMIAQDYAHAVPFALSVGLVGENFESGGFTQWPWQQGGAAGWDISSPAQEGSYCAQSANISDNQTSELTLNLDCGAGDVSFYHKVSSESTYDFLYFYIDGSESASWSGELPWQEASFALSAGNHTLSWVFAKDGSVANGSDCAWIDAIVFPPVVPPTYPNILCAPEVLTMQCASGESLNESLLLSNTGEAALTWSLSATIDARSGNSASPGTVDRLESRATAQSPAVAMLPKGIESQDGSRFSRGAGGPDAFGYSWIDSNEAGGPAYAWNDISGIGSVAGSGDDELFGSFDLGFNFDYYGQSYNSVSISTNGFLTFTSTSSAYGNAGIPTAAEPNALIAPFWDDLNPDNGGTIYYYADAAAQTFTVQFDQVVHYGGADPESFEVVLHADGSILMQYQSVSDASGATIGIEDHLGNDGLECSYNSSGFAQSGLAILFSTEAPEAIWLTVNTLSGHLEPDESINLTVTASALDLADGSYAGAISFDSNDPDTPQLVVPVTFEVSSFVPEPVQNLAIYASISTVVLTWDASLGALAYRVERAENPYGEFVSLGEVGTTFYSAPMDLQRGFYRVVAIY
jgi:murein tripeptide amidase MpaA